MAESSSSSKVTVLSRRRLLAIPGMKVALVFLALGVVASAVIVTVVAGKEDEPAAPVRKSVWTWRCEQGACKRHLAEDVSDGQPLGTCKLTCGALGVLWPRPTGPVTLGATTLPFLATNVTFRFVAPPAVSAMLGAATERFRGRLTGLQRAGPHPAGCRAAGDCPTHVSRRRLQVVVAVDEEATALRLETSEFYQLLVNRTDDGHVNMLLYARTYFGARHALETALQIIDYDETYSSLQVVDSVMISDAPVYPIRALTLDTSRNFVSLAGLRRTVDAMAMNKLNTLHWHVTDSHSFPIEVRSEPRMAQYGAYAPDKVYSAADVKNLTEYARLRGVRLVPELDAPAHVGYGWQWGEKAGLGKLAVCVGKEPWRQYCVEPPCGQMNIVNDNMYDVLKKIYTDFHEMMQPDLFHAGGDEVNINCWKTTKEITDHIINAGGDPDDNEEYLRLWEDYQSRAADIWRNVSGQTGPLILWTSDLTVRLVGSKAARLRVPPSQYIIQVWTQGNDSQIGHLLKKGFRLIMSNYDAWYLDCGFSAWVGKGNNWCAPYKSWQTVYDNSPRQIAQSFGAAEYAELVLGGSAALWAEQSDDATLDTKLWPRAAALAERLWAEPSADSAAALGRLVHHRRRMVARGVGAETLQPEYCHQNDGVCV